jgi:hypothetical protein
MNMIIILDANVDLIISNIIRKLAVPPSSVVNEKLHT